MIDIRKNRQEFRGVRLPLLWRVSVPGALVRGAVWAFLAAALLWTVGCKFYGVVANKDECYMALCCRGWGEQPVAMLSFFTGWIAMRVFGDQVITLRLLAMACYLVAILMPVWYFYRRTGNRLWSVYLFAVVTVVVQCTHIYFYGWDAGAYPYESAMLTLSMCYIDSPSRRKEVLTGCLLGALGMVRVPALVLAGPAAVLVAVAAGRRHGRPASEIWRAVGRGFVSFAATALLLMTVMKGSPAAYFATWVPENIITGHTLRDVAYGYLDWMLEDLDNHIDSYHYWRDSFAALALLLLLGRRSRPVAGVLLLAAVCYRRALLHHSVELPWHLIIIVLLSLAPLHNAVARHIRHAAGAVHVDRLKLALILIYAFVPVAGSDRIMMRITFFYSIPLVMVWLYPLRGGIVRWFLAFMTVPALCAGIYGRVSDYGRCEPIDRLLPYHRYIIDYPGNAAYLVPLRSVAARLEREGKRFGTFGEDRYGPPYLYEKDAPYLLNAFHNYYPAATEAVLRDMCRHLDALFVQPRDTPALTFAEIDNIIRSEGFAPAGTDAGGYRVYEKKEAR